MIVCEVGILQLLLLCLSVFVTDLSVQYLKGYILIWGYIMSVCMCAHVCEDLKRSKQGIRCPGAGYADCGPPNMGAGNSFSSKSFWLLSHLAFLHIWDIFNCYIWKVYWSQEHFTLLFCFLFFYSVADFITFCSLLVSLTIATNSSS